MSSAIEKHTSDAASVPVGGQGALLESFSAIAEALTSGGDLNDVLQCIAEESLRLLRATSARVRMPDATGTQLLLAALADDEHAGTRMPPPDAISYLATDSIAGRAFRTNRIYVARGAPRRGVPKREYALHCTVPLMTRNRTLGVLTVWRATDEPFSEDEVAIVRIFGNAAALAIEQVRLLTEERDRTRRMETLTEVSRIISAATDHDALYEAVYAQCVRLFGVEHFYIARATPDGALVPVLWYTYAERQRAYEGTPLIPSLGGCVLRENKPISTPDVGAEYARRGIPPPARDQRDGHVETLDAPWMGAPIGDGDQAFGVIATNGRATPYTDEECTVLLAIADQLGVAMRNIDLLEEQRARAARMETLADASRVISAATDLSTIYEAVRRECGRLFSVESFYIGHYRETTGEVVPDLWYSRGERLRAMEGAPLEGGLSPVVARTCALLVTDDYIAECKRRGIGIYYPTDPTTVGDAWMGAPLMAGPSLLGVIVINGKRDPYTSEEQEAFVAIASQVSVALTNAQLLHEKEARAERMAALADVSRAISAVTDPDELYDIVYRECGRLLPMANSRICRIIPETGEVFAESYFRHGERVRELEGKVIQGGLSPVIRDTGEALLTNDYPGELVARGMALPNIPLPPANSSWLGVPVMQGNEVYGVISLNTTERLLTTEDRDTLRAVASQIGIAMANARLITRERERATRMAALNDMSRTMSAVLDIDEVLHVIQRETPRLFPSQSLVVAYWDDERRWFHEESRNEGVKHLPLAEVMRERALTRQVVESGELFVTRDYEGEMGGRGLPLRTFPYVSLPTGWIGVPLRAKNQTIGVIAAFATRENLTENNVRVLELVARHAAIAIENARLLERERKRAERLTALNEISRTISAMLDLDPLLHAIARESVRLLDLRAPLVGYRTATGDWITAAGVAAVVSRRDAETGVGPLASIVMQTRAPLVVADYETACGEHGAVLAAPLDACLPSGWMGVPMLIGEQPVGVMAGFVSPEQATAENAQLLSIMANQAAIAIENARLYHDAQELGVVEERNRLAREIHDTIAQGLTATTYQLELADTFLAMEPPNMERAKEKLRRSLELTRANLDEARRSVMDLRAAHLQGVTLQEAFERLAATWTLDAGVALTINAVDAFPVLPSPVSAGLYRIGQEALSNIAKHARATQVAMELEVEEHTVVLTIRDDGMGFDPEIVATQRTARGASGGFGLIGIRERAQLMGGTSDIRSDVGAGTRIVVRVPIKLVN
jgi:GAF domain-containing protein/two-component sensor histidine kinase